MSWTKIWNKYFSKIKNIFPSCSSDDSQFARTVFNESDIIKKKYNHFKRIIKENDYILEIIAELSLRKNDIYWDKTFFVSQVETLLKHCLTFIQALNDLSYKRYTWLYETYDEIYKHIMQALLLFKKSHEQKLFYSLDDISQQYAYIAGNKAANLAEVRNVLGLTTPRGLVVSTFCFQEILRKNQLEDFIIKRLSNLSPEDPKKISIISEEIRNALRKARLPETFRKELIQNLKNIGAKFWAVRSSAIGEDGIHSFAGQFLSKLNVPLEEVPEAYLEVITSLYEERVLHYILMRGLNKQKLLMAVLILEIIDARSSGVLYTQNPNHYTAQEMFLSAIWGLGSNIVSGNCHPDIFIIDRYTGQVKEKKITTKTRRLVLDKKGGIIEEDIPSSCQKQPSLYPHEISLLYQTGLLIEEHFKFPQDIEWCIDKKGHLYILQTRPLKTKIITKYSQDRQKSFFKRGLAVSPGNTYGKIIWLEDITKLEEIPSQAIAIVKNMDPELAKIVPNLAGLIAQHGSVTAHLATILREFQIPAIVIKDLSRRELPPGQLVTIDGFEGLVYLGKNKEVLKKQITEIKYATSSKTYDKDLEKVLSYILPLNLTEISEKDILKGSLRNKIKTIHDIVRFIHEASIVEMFQWGQEDHSEMAHILLSPEVPLIFYIVDLEGGLEPHVTFKKEISIENIRSIPFLALWRGMSHPGIRWTGAVPFDLGSFVSVLSRSFVRKNKDLSGKAFALISREYLNFHSRLAYHFAIVDSFCSERSTSSNYIAFRFQGGGAAIEGRLRRLTIIKNILNHYGFKISIKEDRISAILRGLSKEETEKALDHLGRLMAYVRQLDMAATDNQTIEKYTKAFLKGDYSIVQE